MSELEKILLAEISNNTVWYKFFPYYANVWLVRTNNIYSDIAASDFELENIGLNSDLIVISFQVQKRQYLKATTIAQVIQNDNVFYFDNATKTLLIHFENHKPYHYFREDDIEIGFIIGIYSSRSIDAEALNAGVWNEVQYEPRLLNTPILKDTKDDLFTGRQKLQGGVVEFENSDLQFKNFSIGAGVKKKTGNFVRTLMWIGEDAENADYDDFVVTYQGVIDRIKQGRTITLNLRDIRSTLTKKSPFNYLDTTNFPDIKDPDKEYLMQEAWGNAFGVPLLALNENVNDVSGSDAYTFLICDTSFHSIATDSIKAVYINNKFIDGLTPAVSFNTDQNFAYITIAASYFAVSRDGSSAVDYENMDKVAVDLEGYIKDNGFVEADGDPPASEDELINNGMAIIREILRKNYGYTYNSLYFDLTTWQSFEEDTDVTYNCGLLINKEITTQKQIEQLAADQLGKFIWNVERKFSFDNDDFTGYSIIIPDHKILGEYFYPEPEEDSTSVLSTFRVGIKRKYNQKDDLEYQWHIDDSNERNALTTYNSTYSKSFETSIDNEADAAKYAARVLEFGGISNDTIKISIPIDEPELKTITSGEWAFVQLDAATVPVLGWCKCQIVDKKPDISKWAMNLTLRIFAFYPYIASDIDDKLIQDKYGKYIIQEEVVQ